MIAFNALEQMNSETLALIAPTDVSTAGPARSR